MRLKVVLIAKLLPAQAAPKFLHARVHDEMAAQIIRSRETSIAVWTYIFAIDAHNVFRLVRSRTLDI